MAGSLLKWIRLGGSKALPRYPIRARLQVPRPSAAAGFRVTPGGKEIAVASSGGVASASGSIRPSWGRVSLPLKAAGLAAGILAGFPSGAKVNVGSPRLSSSQPVTAGTAKTSWSNLPGVSQVSKASLAKGGSAACRAQSEAIVTKAFSSAPGPQFAWVSTTSQRWLSWLAAAGVPQMLTKAP